jgi:putative MATE family efflux protein
LIEGNIPKLLLSLSWPMLLGMMGIVVFNLVDTYFVGILGVEQLAAMSFSFPVIMLLNSVSLGIGIGTSSLIARNYIKADHDEVKMMASRALLLGVVIVLVVVAIGMSTIDPLFSAMGAKGDVLDYVDRYMKIWYLGVPFVLFPMIGNSIVRATGDTFTPGMIMVVAGVGNAILDPIFIFGYGPIQAMGIEGAAWATVISRSFTFIVILIILIKRLDLLTIVLGSFKEIYATWKNIVYIAGPASLTMLIPPISAALITRILAGFGQEAVAAFGVATRVEMFGLMVIASLGSVLIIFMGAKSQSPEIRSHYRSH